MDNTSSFSAFLAGLFMVVVSTANAAPLALEGRLPTTPAGTDYQAYYDPNLYVTWVADANINGGDTWDNQIAWVGSFSLGGVSGWRLPDMDVNGDGVVVQCGSVSEVVCRDSEYGYMFYQNGVTLADPGSFINIQSSNYWSSTEIASVAAWVFNFDVGMQSFFTKSAGFFAWPVTDGDVFSSDWLAYVPINFSALHNARMQDFLNGSTLPEGSLVFGGLPFEIPTGGNNVWFAYYAEGPNPRIAEIPVGIDGITEVHTLINTGWGLPGPESYAYIEFIGSDGAYYRRDLVGNDDIRDYNQDRYTNVINETTTINVWNNGFGQRLDKQRYILPIAFHTQTLDTIRLVDNGADAVQRVFLAGVTVKTVLPELDIEKKTNGRDADLADDYDVPRIASGDTVSWTYTVLNTGGVAFSDAEIGVTDSQPGVIPLLDVSSDDGDLMLSPGETWTYTASAAALDLMAPPPGVTVVPGCNDGRNTYENSGRVEIADTTVFDEDRSHYCNEGDVDADGVTDSADNCFLVPNGPLIPDAGGNVQRDTDGDDFGNLCDPDFDNNLVINAADLAFFKTKFFSSDPDADLNGDGVVNAADLAILKIMFFRPPGPSGLVP